MLLLAALLVATSYCTPAATQPAYQWDIQISQGTLNQPVSNISVRVDGTTYPIIDQVDAPMEVLATENYRAKGVPDTALMACAGFWAGYEQVIYLQRNHDKLEAILLTYEEGFDDPQVAQLKTILLPQKP